MLKKIILAAAICGALGTCTIGAFDISSAQEPAREGNAIQLSVLHKHTL